MRRRAAGVALLGTLLVLALFAFSGGSNLAAAALTQLPVKGHAPATEYDPDRFGPRWADVDHDGCDTRNAILARDLTGETFVPGSHRCEVATGILHDPYTGHTIAFRAGYQP
jgi:hypothetical protein